jgi:hypothetical protein
MAEKQRSESSRLDSLPYLDLSVATSPGLLNPPRTAGVVVGSRYGGVPRRAQPLAVALAVAVAVAVGREPAPHQPAVGRVWQQQRPS